MQDFTEPVVVCSKGLESRQMEKGAFFLQRLPDTLVWERRGRCSNKHTVLQAAVVVIMAAAATRVLPRIPCFDP